MNPMQNIILAGIIIGFALIEILSRSHKTYTATNDDSKLELFMFSDKVGSGLPLWLPKGTAVRQRLEDFLKKEFSGYSFWIANYNFFEENIKDDWLFWQFTEKAAVDGIYENVDLNIFNGTPVMLKQFTKSK